MRHRHTHDCGDAPRWGRRFARGLFGRGPRGHAGSDHEHLHEQVHGHGGHGGRARLARFFEHGDLRLVVLQLIAEKPRHGYELIKAIEEKAGGAYTPSPGVIYPTLTLLEELGHVTISLGTDGRKLHTLTEEGTAALAANRKLVDSIFARIAQAGANNEPAPLIRQALDNFRHTLKLRLSQGPLEEHQVHAIIETIEAARTAIEQI